MTLQSIVSIPFQENGRDISRLKRNIHFIKVTTL